MPKWCHPVSGIPIDDLIAKLPFAKKFVWLLDGVLSHSQKRAMRVPFSFLLLFNCITNDWLTGICRLWNG